MNAQDEKMMYRLFLTAVEKRIRSILPPEYEVKRGKALKNNSVELDTIVIREQGEEVVPNIFLNSYYQSYIEGRSTEDICEEILNVYNENRNRFDMERFGDCSLEFFRDRIFFKLISGDRNRMLLEQLPHVKINNLELIFACLIERGGEGIASIRIDNTLMQKWETDAETLFKIAADNTVRLFPPKIFELAEHNIKLLLSHKLDDAAIVDLFENDWKDESNTESDGNDRMPSLFVLTNRDGVDGGYCIIYDGLLERIRRRLGKGFYIIPSSVHEVLILPESTEFNREMLDNMVKEVNSSVLSEMDILSENVYYYPDDCFEVVV
ncbi:MAG: hypothetical protein J6Y89_02155 [Lachnospiraceae bacterium]|nr:hypothetical protein [Lachnospiraceae bacterium]